MRLAGRSFSRVVWDVDFSRNSAGTTLPSIRAVGIPEPRQASRLFTRMKKPGLGVRSPLDHA